MAKLNIEHTYYERLEAIMTYNVEMNGNNYDKGHLQTYNVVEGVEEGLNRLIYSLSIAGKQAEAVTVAGATLNAGTQQYISDKFTNNKEIASITFV